MTDRKPTTRKASPTVTTSEEAGRHLSPLDMTLMEKHRQCPATSKRTGSRCKNLCSLGMRSCRIHGSGTMRAKVAAAERIRAAAGYAAALLVELMADPAVDVKLRADLARDILTRAGIEEAKRVEIAATVEAPWQKLLREGGAIQVVHSDPGAPAEAEDDARPEPRELEMLATPATPTAPRTTPRRVPDASPVPPSDSAAAEAMYRANRAAADPMPTSAVQRVDGQRPRMTERQRRRRS